MNNTNVKLCGNRSFADFKKSVESEVKYIGFVFADSKRQVEPTEVMSWLKKIPLQSHQKIVGVFVNERPTVIKQIAEMVPLDIIQCHGSEFVQDILTLKEHIKRPVWKVIHDHDQSLLVMKSFAGIIDGFVIDRRTKDEWGGTGKRFNWNRVPEYIEEARAQNVSCLIAGGINPDNVSELLAYQPDGIDVSSGIEEKEAKSYRKIEQLIERVKKNESYNAR